MKIKIVYLWLVFLWVEPVFGNAAMPGFWNVGGNGEFIPIFAKDSMHFGKIQMKTEQVCIQLYRGFAVVKGEYNMLNLTNEPISMNVGYPVNGTYFNQEVFSVHFSDLYQLQVWVNGEKLTAKRLGKEPNNHKIPSHLRNPYNWYVWEMRFAPQTLTKITVYFMVNTNTAFLREGYNKDKQNGFTYILESGKAWAEKIEKGRIAIQWMDKLKIEEIRGILPKNSWKYKAEEQLLIYDFENLEPDSTHNILVRYGSTLNDFDFDKYQKKSAFYYQTIDKLQPSEINTQGFKSFTASDFEVHSWGTGFWMSIMLFLGIFGMPIILLVLGASMLFLYIKKYFLQKK